jgi:hypothetical protein
MIEKIIYRDLLEKYISFIQNQDGVNHIHLCNESKKYFTKLEWITLNEICALCKIIDDGGQDRE